MSWPPRRKLLLLPVSLHIRPFHWQLSSGLTSGVPAGKWETNSDRVSDSKIPNEVLVSVSSLKDFHSLCK